MFSRWVATYSFPQKRGVSPLLVNHFLRLLIAICLVRTGLRARVIFNAYRNEAIGLLSDAGFPCRMLIPCWETNWLGACRQWSFFFSMDYPNLVWMKVNGTTSRPSFKGYRQLFALWGRLLNRDILTLWNQEKKQGLNTLLQRFFHFKYCHIEPRLLFDSSAFSCRIFFFFSRNVYGERIILLAFLFSSYDKVPCE